MRRRKKSKIILGLLIAIIGLGVGYAAISGVGLLINGSASVKSTDGNFKVRFVRPDNNETAIENPVENAIVISGHNSDESLMDVSGMSASITDDTHATFSAGGLDEIGECAEFTYTVVNESDKIDAVLSFEIVTENDLLDYFNITKSVNKNKIAKGETATFTVRIRLIGRPRISDVTGTFGITLTATPYDESSESQNALVGDNSGKTLGNLTLVSAKSGETHKGIVYLDPTDLTKDCYKANTQSATGMKEGCMKWYIYDDSGDDYTMILDHNTTERLSWDGSGKNVTYESSNLKVQVENLVTESQWQVTPRLISAQEIKAITNTPNFSLETSDWYCLGSGVKDSLSEPNCNASTNSKYAWLFDYTNGCTTSGCNVADSGNNGYWTSTTVGSANSGNYVWFVYRNGTLNNYTANTNSAGIRPVITISKSNFE